MLSSSLSFVLGLLPLVSAQCPVARAGKRGAIGTVDKRDLLVGRADFSSSLTTLANSFGQCPAISEAAGGGSRSRDWWPCQLRLDVLRQFSPNQDPLGASFDYAKEFAKLDYFALKADIVSVIHKPQPWWPADYGTYGPFFVRLTWHAAGTYRISDGWGGGGMGQQRFAPLNSWPDNANLDKARRLLWPIKQKYGKSISWADLLLLAGNVALQDMGFPVLGFGAGRPDTWQADEGIFWGAETTFVPQGNDVRYYNSKDIVGRADKLEWPLAAAHMGLIYVNPTGPDGSGNPNASALDIRKTFGVMGMNDSETVALIAGGHAFGKAHGASPAKLGPPPEGAPLEAQAFGWANPFGKGDGDDTITSGLEVIWTKTPTNWSNGYLNSLFKNTWTLTKSPAGNYQFEAMNGTLDYPDPFNGPMRHATMLVSDLALRVDPIYRKIAEPWVDDFDALTKAFAAAWFKLLHRDMGPLSRYLGPEVPKQHFIWQDPLPNVTYPPITTADASDLKAKILALPGVNTSSLVSVAWGSAATFRVGDKRGGANGARISLMPQMMWAVNNPARLTTVLQGLNTLKSTFNTANANGKQVSLADLIVLAGNAAVEAAATAAGVTGVTVPFTPGRVDATQADTDVAGFEYLNPAADGFRNFRNTSAPAQARTEELLVEKARQLSLTIPEMTVLVGGMRALGATWDGGSEGVLTAHPGTLTNDFFVNLLDIGTVWTPDAGGETFTGKARDTGAVKWTATRADLVFGAQSELRAVAEVYAQAGGKEQLVADFVAAWAKVMDLDRYDVKGLGGMVQGVVSSVTTPSS